MFEAGVPSDGHPELREASDRALLLGDDERGSYGWGVSHLAESQVFYTA